MEAAALLAWALIVNDGTGPKLVSMHDSEQVCALSALLIDSPPKTSAACYRNVEHRTDPEIP